MKKVFILFAAMVMTMAMQAKVAFLVPGQTTNKSEMPAQWDNRTFEHTAYDWFQTEYVNNGKGDFISFTNIPTDTVTYKVIWVYIDREWLQAGTPFSKEKFDELFTEEIVTRLSNYVKAGGRLFLGKQAGRLAYKMNRIAYEPVYNCGGYSQDDRYWGIKGKFGNGTYNTIIDCTSHPIYQGLTTATMDKNEGCFPLLHVTGTAHSTDNNCHWGDFLTPNENGVYVKQPNHNDSLRLVTGWETYWNAKALGTWTGIGDYCILQAIEFFPKGDFKGTIITLTIGAYQFNADNAEDAKANTEHLTANALNYLHGSFVSPEHPTAMENVESSMECKKMIMDGRLVIRRGNQYFDACGNIIK
ncbi:MAG: DUF4960 domain-containing protein [Paludibacteraceae bacterium]